MKILPQVLKLCFWALPAQRVCTVAGISLMVAVLLTLALKGADAVISAPAFYSARLLERGVLGLLITFLPALVMGGPMWRAFSAQRGVSLAPGGRTQLLLAAIVMAVLAGLGMAAFYFLLFLGFPPRLRMSWGGLWPLFASTFIFASWWAMASFFAARSSLAMFTVLLVLLGGGYVAVLLDLPLPGQLSPGRGVSVMLVCWGLFAAWYLRTRRIKPSAWSSRRADNEAFVTPADTGGISAGVSRPAALERLLLGGRSIVRILIQWVLALALLQALLLGVRALVDASPVLVAPVQFSVLLLVLPAMGAASWLLASHLRQLWLVSRCDRAALFALAEGKLVLIATGLAVISAAAFLLLWFTLPMPPATSLAFGLCSLLGALLLPPYAALAQGKDGATAASIMAMLLLPAVLAVYAYLKFVVSGEPGGSWWWLAPLPVATVALRTLARRRWLTGDMPRALTAPAS